MSTDNPIAAEHDADGYALIGACFEVLYYNEMGNGYLEDVYQESLEMELADRRILFVAQPKLPIFYKGRPLRKQYEADLLVLDKIIVELKAVKILLRSTKPSFSITSKPRAAAWAISSISVPSQNWPGSDGCADRPRISAHQCSSVVKKCL